MTSAVPHPTAPADALPRMLHHTWARVSGLLGAAEDLDTLLQSVTDAAVELTRAQFGAFFYNAVGERGESYRLYVVSGVDRERFANFPMPRNTSIFGPTFRGEAPVRLDDVTADPRYGQNPPYDGMPPGHLPVRSYLAAPVTGRSGGALGGLFLGSELVGVFSPEDEDILVALAAQAAVAIESVRLVELEKQARERAEAAVGRLLRLQSISARLAEAQSLAEVADVVVSTAATGVGADGAMIGALSPDGRMIDILAASGYDADVVARWSTFPVDAVNPGADAVRTGETVLISSRADGLARYPDLAGAVGDEHVTVALPLVGHGRIVGVMGFTWRSTDFRLDDELRSFLGSIGQQCGQALERARLYDASVDNARLLQRSLLPVTVPEVPGVELATRYQPVEDGALVGGDFFDVFRRGDGAWGLTIGDVSGKGVQAAAFTGLVRHTARAAARRGSSPAAVLDELNVAVLEDTTERYATVAHLVLRPEPPVVRVTVSLAGHPPALLRSADGSVRLVGEPGTAVGLVDSPTYLEDSLLLARGNVLVLYTDGFTDARSPSGELADDLIIRALRATSVDDSAEDIADALLSAVMAFCAGRARDDMALVVVRV